MEWQKEMEIADHVWDNLNNGVAPITIRKELQVKFEISKSEAIQHIHEAQQHMLKARYCENVGHDFEVTANITPDSGSESFYCKHCGYGDTIIYY